MTIYVIGTRGFPDVQGGIERHCEQLYPRLAEHGIKITVFTRSSYIPRQKRVKEWKGVRFIHLWNLHNMYLETIIHTLIGIIISRLYSPDFIHIHAIGPSLLIPFARMMGLKIIFTHHGHDYNREKWGCCARFMLRLGEWLGVTFAHHVITVSRNVQDTICGRFKRSDCIFIPNGVELPERPPDPTVLTRYNIQAQQYVLAVGRFVPEKGLHQLIQAYNMLPEDSPKLVIVGGADHETSYSRRLEKYAKDNPNIVFTGVLHKDTLHSIYHYARLFVFPSLHEGLPITVLEAMSYGLPVIASDIPGVQELPLEPFSYYKSGNRDRLCSKLLSFLREPHPSKIKYQYTEVIKNKYNWDRIADRFIEVIQDR